MTPVIAVRVPNVPRGLASLLEFCDENDMNVEYGYCFSVGNERAIDVLKIEGPDAEASLSQAVSTSLNLRRSMRASVNVDAQMKPGKRARFATCALALVLGASLVSFHTPADAYADVRKSDLIAGKSVEERASPHQMPFDRC